MAPQKRPVIAHTKARSKHSFEIETAWHYTLRRKKRKVHKYNDRALRNDFRPRLAWNMNLQTYDQIFDSHLSYSSLKFSHRFVCGSHAFAMFSAHFTWGALFRKRVLLDHLLAKYGSGCFTWFSERFFLLSVWLFYYTLRVINVMFGALGSVSCKQFFLHVHAECAEPGKKLELDFWFTP